jgi:hypothetical protein
MQGLCHRSKMKQILPTILALHQRQSGFRHDGRGLEKKSRHDKSAGHGENDA